MRASGNLSSPDVEHVVLGDLAVHEDDSRPLTREVEES